MLYLLPNLLDEQLASEQLLPVCLSAVVKELDGLIAESHRSACRFLRRFQMKLPIALLNEHTRPSELQELLKPLQEGKKWGLISDAGLPCIADPGSELVFLARELKIPVEAIPGPSSIYLALMLSGLRGQAFAFHGYLPKDQNLRIKRLKNLEKRSAEERATQIFMEAPYRSRKSLEELIGIFDERTFLSVAWDLSLPNQGVITQSVKKWKQTRLPSIDDRPALFLFFQMALS